MYVPQFDRDLYKTELFQKDTAKTIAWDTASYGASVEKQSVIISYLEITAAGNE